jgi:hypothetical protein
MIRTLQLYGDVVDRHPIGDREHGFVDGVRVCLPDKPAGSWYWVADDQLLVPTGAFRTTREAMADAVDAIDAHQRIKSGRRKALEGR